MGFIFAIFTKFIYQPFFNLLVGIYDILIFIFPSLDMGVAVIIFTIIFRIFILPLSIASSRSERERRNLAMEISKISEEDKDNASLRKTKIRKLLHGNKRMVLAEIFDIGIQILIAIMLYRIFTTGIKGVDFHLLYRFIPQPANGFNLTFLSNIDLTKPSFQLNIITSLVILITESLNIATSPFPWTREDKMTLLVLPIIAFLFFSQMPAGKKLFIITTLLFTIMLILVKQIIFVYHNLKKRFS